MFIRPADGEHVAMASPMTVVTDNFADLPRRHYGVIVADPPWSFASWTDKGKTRAATTRQKGIAGRAYATMTPAEISELPVASIAAKNSVLFLWAVSSQLPEAIELGRAWNFAFKTIGFVWAKSNYTRPGLSMGMGSWTRQNAEMCLLFTRGSPRRKSASVRQTIIAPRREHSRKPPEVLDRIEELLPGPFIELFARGAPRSGWSAWGDEVEAPQLAVAAE
jgi:N6-adenosine-specific RNA methylase IME4